LQRLGASRAERPCVRTEAELGPFSCSFAEQADAGGQASPAELVKHMQIFDDEVRVIRRSKLVLAAALMPVLFGAGLGCTDWPFATALGALLAWLGAGLALHVWARNPTASEHAARARADVHGLSIDGRLALAAQCVQGGWLEPRSFARPVVHVCAFGVARDVHLVVRHSEQGRALLRALSVDATRVCAHYWAMALPLCDPRAFTRTLTAVGIVVALGLVAGHAVPAALALAVVALAVLFAGAVVPTHVSVGADGVLVRWLGATRYVPWSRVAGIEAFEGGVVLAIEGGRWLTLRMPAGLDGRYRERGAMLERMRVAWRGRAQARPDETAPRLFRRAGGRTREWVRAMRAIGSAPAGYRSAAMPRERLWRIVENPRADRVSRTGAALALSPGLDEGGRDRLFAAASSCAEPRLRIALTTAAANTGASATEDELAASLDAIEREGEDEDAEGFLSP
jgi:hypothetical protein